MRARGETRSRSAWMRATRLGPLAPRTNIGAGLRTLCMLGEKALWIRARPGAGAQAHFGTPPDPEHWTAWRVDGVSVFLDADEVPQLVSLDLGPSADVLVEIVWKES